MQGLAQRVTAIRPDLVNSDATFGELAWIWGKGHARDGGSWLRRLWFSGHDLVAWESDRDGVIDVQLAGERIAGVVALRRSDDGRWTWEWRSSAFGSE